MLFSQFIFKLFPYWFKEQDTYKNVDNQGLLERFCIALGQEIDSEIKTAISNLASIMDPLLVDENLLGYLAQQKGLNFAILEDTPTQRKVIKYAVKANQLRGTGAGYKFLLGLMGYEVVTITELGLDEATFDTGDLFDDGRRFDTTCPVCSDYSLSVENSFLLSHLITSSEYKSLLNAIAYMEPIIAHLQLPIELNGADITEITVLVTYDDDGNILTYYNEFDPNFTLTQLGATLIPGGPHAGNYAQSGIDLIYTLP